MTQYNSLNVKLSNSQLNKLKSSIKNGTEVVLRLSPTMIGDSNDEINFPYKLLITDRQVLHLHKALQLLHSVLNMDEHVFDISHFTYHLF